jgi:hypothetical protein
MLIFIGFLSAGVYAGAKSEPEKEPRNPEWILGITAFDVSALPPARQVVGDLLLRNLVDGLNSIAYRVRVSQEYTFYKDYAWSKDRTAAAKTLVEKRGQRDKLVFEGYPEWKYQKELKKIDEEIAKLEETLKTVEGETPLIAAEPVFKLPESTRAGTFPPPPNAGLEYQFCMKEQVDGFLTGRVVEFHGRLYVTFRFYTRYSQSFQYEDDVIFSVEDTQQGIDELVNRVAAAVSGAKPASLLVYTEPEDALIMLDGSFGGYGNAGPVEHPPGTVTVESFADNYQPSTTPLELRSGELAELYINLQPLSKEALTITVPDEAAQVYQGSLYLGETPLEVDVDTQQSTYFHVETAEGKTGSAIMPGGAGGTSNTLFLRTGIPTTAAEGKVAKVRRNFYGSWARFWIALPTAFLLQGISDAQIKAYNSTGHASLHQTAQNGRNISIGAWILFGLVTAEVLYRTGVYIYTAGKTPDPLVGTGSGTSK